MSVPFAINGLGRVGRALVRIVQGCDDLRLVAVNDPVPAPELAALLARDTVRGPYPGDVGGEPGALLLDGRRVPVSAAPEPAACPWAGAASAAPGVEATPHFATPRFVVEATGRFLAREAAAGHLGADGGGVERVIVSANAPEADVTLCLGVNAGEGAERHDLDPARHRVISNASCTTNCLAPLLRVLDHAFGVERAVMSTVHSYTGNHRLVDSAHPEARRRRAAAVNIIPVATTAPAAVERLMPSLAGRVSGLSVRVPTPMGAMMELAVDLASGADDGALRDAFRAAAGGELGTALAAALAVSGEELVSSDFVGHPASAVVDLPLTHVVDRRLARVVAWYDNEWGYAHRLADLLRLLAAT